jgi:glutamate-1-semialdehyde 2,1-aminomutase
MNRHRLLEELAESYKSKHKKSEEIFNRASRLQVRGGSHNLRLFAPFPFYAARYQGSRVVDVDGNEYVDFWQGHFANVLGHNPQLILDTLSAYYREKQGLTTGIPSPHQSELAELILTQIGADKIRFTTSGTLATMYAIMLAKAHTGRDMVLKIGGGWHGAQPYVLKGIFTYEKGFNQLESAGLPPGVDSMIAITRFNDEQDLEETFQKFGERLSCFILEPFIGAGGLIFSTRSYLQRAKELTQEYEALLIFDEVISGFRFHPGGVQALYGVKPDLTVLGKAIGGGMPLSAVAGREDVMALCSPEAKAGKRVKFDGGTFSAHPASILAGATYIRHLIENSSRIYPEIGRLGEKVRTEIEAIFESFGFSVRCTGYGSGIAKNSSLVGVQFLHPGYDRHITSPEQVWDPDICDVEMREKMFKLAMLEEGFNIFHGYGSISAAHTEQEIQDSLAAVERIARKWSQVNRREA